MQYILTEEEFKVLQKCKNLVENDYTRTKNLEQYNPKTRMRVGMLEYALGIRLDKPNLCEV